MGGELEWSGVGCCSTGEPNRVELINRGWKESVMAEVGAGEAIEMKRGGRERKKETD